MSREYYYQDLVDALHEVGIQQNDLVCFHIALDRIGLPLDWTRYGNPDGLLLERPAEMLLELFSAVIPTGTILVPAFSYSFCGKNEVFDPRSTRSDVGNLSNYIIKKSLWQRSLDPLFSYVGRGYLVDELFENIPNTSFGHDSVSARLVSAKTKVCQLGCEGIITLIHHFEWINQAPYRFDKTFRGMMVTATDILPVEWIYYVRVNDPRTVPDLTRLDQIALSEGVMKRVPIGNSHISAFDLNDYFKVAQKCYDQDPFCLIKEPIPLEELEQLIREDKAKSQGVKP